MKQAIFTKFLLFSLFICFCGCSEKEDPAQITIGDSSVEYFQSRMDFPSEGGSKTITFSTNKNWVISVSESGMDVDWCSVTPSTGVSGDITVTINVKENTSYGERNVVLTLTAGDAVEKLRVSQKQNDAILLSSTLFEVPMEGEEIELQVKSNVNYIVEIPEQYKSWIHGESATRSLESKDLRFKIDCNEDYEKREGEIVISDGNITEVVKIYQAGGGILVLSQNEYNIPSNGGTITVDLSSNFEYEYQMPDVDWIKLDNGTRGMSSHSLNFDILPNELYDGRSATILFFDSNGTANETVTINQAQKDAILIFTPCDNSLSFKEQTVEIRTMTNIDFEVQTDSEWIKCLSTRGLKEASIILNIAENKTFEKRTSKLILTHNSAKDIIEFTQYGQPIDLSSNETANSYIVPPTDSNIYYSINASVAGNDESHHIFGGNNAIVVWETYEGYSLNKLVEDLEYQPEKERIIFRVNDSEGNALIALQNNNDEILWSWHLWVTNYIPEENFITLNNGNIIMDRYLGASSDEGIGLYYQWGRKDPFAAGKYKYLDYESNTYGVNYSITHPNTFMVNNDQTQWDWNTEHTATWSSKKTIYDPCPPGWKVMDESCVPLLSEGYVDNYSIIINEPNCTPQTKFRYTGLLHTAGHIQGTYEYAQVWTNRGSYHWWYDALPIIIGAGQLNNGTYMGRAYGKCIRCQRDD